MEIIQNIKKAAKVIWEFILFVYEYMPWWFWKWLEADNFGITLHCPVTPLILLFVSVYVGYINEIKCFGRLEDKYVSTRCLTTETYMIATKSTNLSNDSSIPTLCHFYEWVPSILFAQAFFFVLPRFIFRYSGGSTVSRLVSHKNIRELTKYTDWGKSERKIMGALVREVKSMLGSDKNNVWARNLFACDVYNLINLVFQFSLLNYFLNFAFFLLGIPSLENRFRKMFPLVVRCVLNEIHYDDKCLLERNGYYAGIFIFLWWWIIILSVITLCSLALRLKRYNIFKDPTLRSDLDLMILGYCTLAPDTEDVKTVLQRCQFSDVIMLNYLALHLDDTIFCKLMQCLADRKKQLLQRRASNSTSTSTISRESDA